MIPKRSGTSDITRRINSNSDICYREKEEGGKRGGRGRVDGEEIGGRAEGGREKGREREGGFEKEWEEEGRERGQKGRAREIGEREWEGGRGRSCWREREKGFERNRGRREREGERGCISVPCPGPYQSVYYVELPCQRVVHSPLVNTAPLGHTQLTNETRPACKAQGQSLGRRQAQLRSSLRNRTSSSIYYAYITLNQKLNWYQGKQWLGAN
jgi:hypothetical protein